MSGPVWTPEWMLSRTCRCRRGFARWSPAADRQLRLPNLHRPVALDAAEAAAAPRWSAASTTPAIGIWNLGNEPDLCPARLPRTRSCLGPAHDRPHQRTGPGPPRYPGHAHARPRLRRWLPRQRNIRRSGLGGDPQLPMYTVGRGDRSTPISCRFLRAHLRPVRQAHAYGGVRRLHRARPAVVVWKWQPYGRPRQYMASGEASPRTSSWCCPSWWRWGRWAPALVFADYARNSTAARPAMRRHERFFGLSGPTALQPHAECSAALSPPRPPSAPPSRRVVLDVSPEALLPPIPWPTLVRLYEAFLASG